jgi:hypothetical protein
MAASEVYDFVSVATPDYNAEIGILPQGEIQEQSAKNQKVHYGVDGSEKVVSFESNFIFYISIGWKSLSEADSGTIFDWYNDPLKANGTQRSFKYIWGDGHTYVVRFVDKLSRVGQLVSLYGISGVKLKILGKI